MAAWTTGAAILAQAGAAPGSADEQAWAELCAEAVNAGLDARLAGAVYASPPLPPELVRVALEAGVDAFKAREASIAANSPDAAVGDYLLAHERIIGRYATVGIS